MCLILELAMLVAGIVTLVRGRLELPGDKRVTGMPAYIVGGMLIASVPIFLALTIGVEVIAVLATGNELPPGSPLHFLGPLATLVILVAVLVVAHSNEDPPTEPRIPPHLDPNHPLSPYRPPQDRPPGT
jgi:hypothetical protein